MKCHHIAKPLTVVRHSTFSETKIISSANGQVPLQTFSLNFKKTLCKTLLSIGAL
jgi:hypothetical protein